MSLAPRSRLGPYEIVSSLGAGGMGEVYKARDTRLNRTVAIKSLQAAVASDPERVARFEREAQLLASLNHPNIGGIHGLQEANGATYLVLEFVDGKPLDAVLRDGGPMPASAALPVAKQIADAIAAAHDRGIIHRDLKPGNVMLTADDQVKVLDFGLGKAIADDAAHGASQSNSPTMTIGGTQAGVILGTAGYMSPEQAKGRSADRRSDVWSFGCLLFEMLSGRRAFEGEDVTDTIAAIVRGEPDWSALPSTTPPALRSLIERCLIKDRTQRLPDMSVVRYILGEGATGSLGSAGSAGSSGSLGSAGSLGSSGSRLRPPRSMVLTLWVSAAVLFFLAAVFLGIGYFTRGDAGAPPAGPLSRFTIVLPEDNEVVVTNMVPLAISPDGAHLVYSGRQAGKPQLFIHDITTAETTALEGTDGAYSPFMSPDGRWIGFFAKGRLKKISIGGTSLQELADVGQARGGAWSPDDNIYYAQTNVGGLWKVPASGGTAVQLTKLDPDASEISHRNPYVLPGGKALLFMIWTGPGTDEHRIEYLSLADGKRQVVVANADGPVTLVNGQIVYAGRSDTLLTAPWDPSQPSLQGVEPKVLSFPAVLDNEGVAAYAATRQGTFVHLMGGAKRRLARIVWVDKQGKIEPLPIPERDYISAVISPDGTRAAIQSRGAIEEIWIYDFRTKSFTPFSTPGGSSQAALWTVDSRYLIYRGTRKGTRNLYRKAADGSGSEERLTTQPGVANTPYSASPDGKWIVYSNFGQKAGGGADIWKIALDAAHETEAVVATTATEGSAQISPDGRWLSFDSDVSGRSEVWVRPFAGAEGAMRQVSRDGGQESRWSRDGRELYYTVPNGVMVVTVSGDSFSAPRLLFEGRYRPAANSNTNWDVAKDGRFLMVQPVQPTKPQTRIEVVLNAVGRER